MDAYEATKVVFARVQALDPDLASKIMGMLLIQDKSEEDMIRLAFGPEHLLHAVVARARADLLAAAHRNKPSSPPTPPWASGLSTEDAPFAGDQARYDSGGDGFYPPEEFGCWSPASDGQHRLSFSLSDAEAAAGGWKPCMYYSRGFCKNGSSCRFVHGPPDNLSEQDLEVWTAAVRSELMASAFPFSPPPRGLNFLLQQHQQQQSESQRSLQKEKLQNSPEDPDVEDDPDAAGGAPPPLHSLMAWIESSPSADGKSPVAGSKEPTPRATIY